MTINFQNEMRKRNKNLIREIENSEQFLENKQILQEFIVPNKNLYKITYEYLFNNFTNFSKKKSIHIIILLDLFFLTNTDKGFKTWDLPFLRFLISELLHNQIYYRYGIISLYLFFKKLSYHNIYLLLNQLEDQLRLELFDMIIKGIINNKKIDKNPNNFFSILKRKAQSFSETFDLEDLNYRSLFIQITIESVYRKDRNNLNNYKDKICKHLDNKFDIIFKNKNNFILLKVFYALFYDAKNEFFLKLDKKIMDNCIKIESISNLSGFLKRWNPNHFFFEKFHRKYIQMIENLAQNSDNIHKIGLLLDNFNFNFLLNEKGYINNPKLLKRLLTKLEFLYRTNQSSILNSNYQYIQSLITRDLNNIVITPEKIREDPKIDTKYEDMDEYLKSQLKNQVNNLDLPNSTLKDFLKVLNFLINKMIYNQNHKEYIQDQAEQWYSEHQNDKVIEMETKFFQPFLRKELKTEFGEKIIDTPTEVRGHIDLKFSITIPIELKVLRDVGKESLSEKSGIEILEEIHLSQFESELINNRIGFLIGLDFRKNIDSAVTRMPNREYVKFILKEYSNSKTLFILLIFSANKKPPSKN